MLTEARESVFHQGNSNCILYLIVASIKSQRNGIKWRRDSDELMAFVMAIESIVIGECVEGIRVEVRREELRMVLMCLEFFLL